MPRRKGAKRPADVSGKVIKSAMFFSFALATLGIELLQSELPTFARRLMTLAADEKSAQ
jgi:hypothetical protein